VFAVPFRRLPDQADLPGEPERLGGKVDALVRGVDLSAGPGAAPGADKGPDGGTR
jgi:hypothetical protein